MTKIIVAEGLDYAGKSSTVIELREALEEEGYAVTLLREPGGSDIGDQLKRLLISPSLEMEERTRLMLFFASRQEMVIKHLSQLDPNEKRIIILDRYVATTFAYTDQSHWDFLWQLKTLIAPPIPHLTFYLDIDKATMEERIAFENRSVPIDGIERKVLESCDLYRRRYTEYFTQSDNGKLITLNAKYPTTSHVYRIMEELKGLCSNDI